MGEVQANHGETHIVPAEVVPDAIDGDDPEDIREALREYVDGTIDDADPVFHRHVWLARLSASGYIDCTDWSIHTSEAEAESYLVDTYDDGD